MATDLIKLTLSFSSSMSSEISALGSYLGNFLVDKFWWDRIPQSEPIKDISNKFEVWFSEIFKGNETRVA